MSLKILDLGLVHFRDALAYQKQLHAEIQGSQNRHCLILCRHFPVITLGRSAKDENIIVKEDILCSKNIKVYRIERGGDVTYHGPGQLVAYPIFNLHYLKKDIHWFLRKLEDVAMDSLAKLGVPAEKKPPLTGLWVAGKKISSIGITIRNWTSYHGMSINLFESDLLNFKLIKPCGMDIQVTSAEDTLHKKISLLNFKEILVNNFRLQFFNN